MQDFTKLPHAQLVSRLAAAERKLCGLKYALRKAKRASGPRFKLHSKLRARAGRYGAPIVARDYAETPPLPRRRPLGTLTMPATAEPAQPRLTWTERMQQQRIAMEVAEAAVHRMTRGATNEAPEPEEVF